MDEIPWTWLYAFGFADVPFVHKNIPHLCYPQCCWDTLITLSATVPSSRKIQRNTLSNKCFWTGKQSSRNLCMKLLQCDDSRFEKLVTGSWIRPQFSHRAHSDAQCHQHRCQDVSHGQPTGLPCSFHPTMQQILACEHLLDHFFPLSTFKAQPLDWLAKLTCKNAYFSWVF